MFCEEVRKSGSQEVRKDWSKYFYFEVEKCINTYADQLGIGGAYAKDFESIRIDEVVRLDGVFFVVMSEVDQMDQCTGVGNKAPTTMSTLTNA